MSSSTTHDDYASRANALQAWFRQILPRLPTQNTYEHFHIRLIKGDASFRRYFRAYTEQSSFILVDAPPQKEDSKPFVQVSKLYQQAGVKVPDLYVVDIDRGFLCLSDFGDRLLWEPLNSAQQTSSDFTQATALYQMAFEQLQKIQTIPVEGKLPEYSIQLMLDETSLFRHWFCEKLLGLKLKNKAEKILSQSFGKLVDVAHQQPQLSVHRDFHSRNLMVLKEGGLGVIDYQDAVLGPVAYDLVSLLKDCYITWPREQVLLWLSDYYHASLPFKSARLSEAETIRYFDLMGAQRHLKAIGIFSRLYLRDQKINYLGDIPRTLNYLTQLAGEYEELDSFLDWLGSEVMLDIEDKIVAAISADSAESAL